ncbi:reverse transcriptase domain-containing protein [Pseudomonas quasicaspiana]|nr:reverse transcriptase domain-containing protein [Pseudomonas quasicaspiana]
MSSVPFSFADIFKPGLSGLPNLARLLGTNQNALLELLYPNNVRNYKNFQIKKKNGNSRSIHAPKKVLKALQRNMADYLTTLHTPKPSSHGFLIERSIKSNSIPHAGKEYVFNIDLEDFFESIHFGRVKNLFMSRPFNAPHNVAVVLAQLCCYDGKLAMGAPTSPIISNMICRKLDSQLQLLAAGKNCYYTRYADDITFSFTSSKKLLPSDIVQITEGGVGVPGGALLSIIERNGFRVNPTKTRLRHRSQRQIVTGLTVNKFPNVSRSFIRRTASMIHALKKFGAVDAEQRYLEILSRQEIDLAPRQAKRTTDSKGDFFPKVINGRLNFIQMVRGKNDSIYRKLAYAFSVAVNEEDKDLLKSAQEILGESVFSVLNLADANSEGSAFLLSGVGIVTNQHVIDGIDFDSPLELLEFSTTENPSRKLNPQLIYKSKVPDIAIFYPGEEFDRIRPLVISKQKHIRPLDPILAVGFPGGFDSCPSPYINGGKVVQGRHIYEQQHWLVDIPLLQGNSGGPIFDTSMEVIGVASRGSKKNNLESILHAFIPIDTVVKAIRKPEFLYRQRYIELRLNRKTGKVVYTRCVFAEDCIFKSAIELYWPLSKSFSYS